MCRRAVVDDARGGVEVGDVVGVRHRLAAHGTDLGDDIVPRGRQMRPLPSARHRDR